MIKPQEIFFSKGQIYFGPSEEPRTEAHCNVWDSDRLQMFKVRGTAKLFQPDENVDIPTLAQFVDYGSPQIRAVTDDDDGLLT